MQAVNPAYSQYEASFPAAKSLKPSTPVSTNGSGAAQSATSQSDSVQISPAARQLVQAGRIALDQKAGAITGDQATALYSQIAATQKQIRADKTANGGTLNAADIQSLNQTQTLTSDQIYSDGHNGAAPPTSAAPVSPVSIRTLAQTGRVTLDEQAGNLTGSQAAGFGAQILTTQQRYAKDLQSNGGPLSGSQMQSFNRMQSILSAEIQSSADATKTA